MICLALEKRYEGYYLEYYSIESGETIKEYIKIKNFKGTRLFEAKENGSQWVSISEYKIK